MNLLVCELSKGSLTGSTVPPELQRQEAARTYKAFYSLHVRQQNSSPGDLQGRRRVEIRSRGLVAWLHLNFSFKQSENGFREGLWDFLSKSEKILITKLTEQTISGILKNSPKKMQFIDFLAVTSSFLLPALLHPTPMPLSYTEIPRKGHNCFSLTEVRPVQPTERQPYWWAMQPCQGERVPASVLTG